ncbi:MAG: hypothetical protein QNK23_08930 [Crocinitomicaceae bacterium]|nr:hypothetical protein [Crocinitomicaceae bacterium]
MRLLLLLVLLNFSHISSAQYVDALCNIIAEVNQHRISGVLEKVKGEGFNESGFCTTVSIPPRFTEGNFRELGDSHFSIEYKTFGKPKQIDKIWKVVSEEINQCYPNLILETSENSTDEYQKYFFCDPSEAEGNHFVRDYEKLAIKIQIIYRKDDQSEFIITLQ